MRNAVVGTGIVAAVLISAVAFGQVTAATDVTKEDYLTVKDAPAGGVDRQVKVVDIGQSNVAVGILHRDALEATEGRAVGIVHTRVTEVYYIYSGGGILMTGGTVSDRRDIPSDSHIVTTLVGESYRASAIGGETRHVSEGDIVVIPGGVFHGWTEIEDHVTYLSIRPDPDKVLPAGWVNPLISP
jgi:mannose-6-phosphate isomerase-like protein (cupin superfamily)